jgi:catechol 2,3-dioxygenase-like lactoylglutathione lyase family enzyme
MLFSKIGLLEIELIESIGDCMRKDFLNTSSEGIQHFSFFVDDIDEVVEYMAEKGYKVVQRGWRPNKGCYAFFDTEDKCGFMLEIIQR